jgi:hypothetical protein
LRPAGQLYLPVHGHGTGTANCRAAGAPETDASINFIPDVKECGQYRHARHNFDLIGGKTWPLFQHFAVVPKDLKFIGTVGLQ